MTNNPKQWPSHLVLPGLVLFSLLITILLSFSSPVNNLKLNVVDQLFEIRGPIAIEDSSVVIISISQQADQEIPYKYPWPTNLHGKLVENLNEAGAKVIGFDVIFDQRDNYNLANDTLFANTIKKHGNVILGGSIQHERQSRGGGSSSISTTFVRPNDVLRSANKNPVGIVRSIKDADAKIRQYILQMTYNNERYLSLGLELLNFFNGINEQNIEKSAEKFTLGPYSIPLYSSNLMTINYFGGPGTFSRFSYETVIDDSTIVLASEDSSFQINSFSDPRFGLKQSGVFEDKIVLIGATMPELNDLHSTPFADQNTMPGVEMHANAIQTILSGKYIHYMPPIINLFILLGLIVAAVFSVRATSGFGGFALYVLAGIGITAAVLVGFLWFRFVMDFVSMMIALTVGYISMQSYEYVIEQREKRRIRGLFSSYVSPAVVEEMVARQEEPKLGGDEIYITAFFSDIESFATISEQLPAEQLVKLLNEYLSAMTNILTEHGGTLDKYIGDAIVAFFGAPVSQEDHAYKACVVSQLMQQKLTELQSKWESEGEQWPELVQQMRTRIGINTGTIVTGNMGSESRFNYTMMGDDVNLASRCETGSKQYGIYTMVTAATKEEAQKYGDRCVFRLIDRIIVKGRTQPVDVYEIMGLRDYLSEQQFECKEYFEKGIEAYRNRQWNEAHQFFERSLELEQVVTNDHNTHRTNPSAVYLDRCKHMKENPPDEDWDGVYVMQEK